MPLLPLSSDDHQVIWLEPFCHKCNAYPRTWCQDNIYEPCEECGRQPTKYIIASEQLTPKPPENES